MDLSYLYHEPKKPDKNIATFCNQIQHWQAQGKVQLNTSLLYLSEPTQVIVILYIKQLSC